MRRRTAVILGAVAPTLATAVVAVVCGRAASGRQLLARYAAVDASTLAGLSDGRCDAYDGKRVRVAGMFLSSNGSGPPYELVSGKRAWGGGFQRGAHRIYVVPMPGDAVPAEEEDAVYWGVLAYSRHGGGRDAFFTLTSDRPAGIWSGPTIDLFTGVQVVVMLPYLGVLLAVGIGVRRGWHLHRLRRLRPGRCPACGYDRRGLPAGRRCPECGR